MVLLYIIIVTFFGRKLHFAVYCLCIVFITAQLMDYDEMQDP